MPLPIVPLAGAAARGLAGAAAPAARSLAGKSLPAAQNALTQFTKGAPMQSLAAQVRPRMMSSLPGLQQAAGNLMRHPMAQELAGQMLPNLMGGSHAGHGAPAMPHGAAPGGVLGHVAQAAMGGGAHGLVGGLMQGAESLAAGYLKKTPAGMLLQHTAIGQGIAHAVEKGLNNPFINTAVGTLGGPAGRAIAMGGAGTLQKVMEPKA